MWSEALAGFVSSLQTLKPSLETLATRKTEASASNKMPSRVSHCKICWGTHSHDWPLHTCEATGAVQSLPKLTKITPLHESLQWFSKIKYNPIIIHYNDITNGITWAVFCFHIAHISFASSWYFFRLSVIVLARLCIFGTAMSIKKVFFVFLLMDVISGRLKSIVLSVSMLRFQYSLKLSFSSTLDCVYF
jgi:hypothetical protein